MLTREPSLNVIVLLLQGIIKVPNFCSHKKEPRNILLSLHCKFHKDWCILDYSTRQSLKSDSRCKHQALKLDMPCQYLLLQPESLCSKVLQEFERQITQSEGGNGKGFSMEGKDLLIPYSDFCIKTRNTQTGQKVMLVLPHATTCCRHLDQLWSSEGARCLLAWSVRADVAYNVACHWISLRKSVIAVLCHQHDANVL